MSSSISLTPKISQTIGNPDQSISPPNKFHAFIAKQKFSGGGKSRSMSWRELNQLEAPPIQSQPSFDALHIELMRFQLTAAILPYDQLPIP